MTEYSKRIALWDNLKFFLIVAVVMGHSMSYFRFEHLGCNGVYIFLYSFHMPAFIFVSGLFSKKTVDQNAIGKVTPYLLLYFLTKFIPYFFNYAISGKYKTLKLLSEGAIPWFCLSIFFMHVITMYTKRYRKGYVMAVALIASCLAGYFRGDPNFLIWLRTATFYPFFYLGYILNPDSVAERFSDIKIRIISCIGLVLFFFICVINNKKLDPVYYLFTGRHFYSDLPDYQIFGGIFRFGTFLLSFVLTFMLISVMPRKKTFFSWIGQRTLAVYAFHGPCIYLIYNKLGMSRLPSMMPYGWQLMIVVISVLISVICSNYVFNWIVKKIMACNWKLKKEELA